MAMTRKQVEFFAAAIERLRRNEMPREEIVELMYLALEELDRLEKGGTQLMPRCLEARDHP